jgi:hypothetical protein
MSEDTPGPYAPLYCLDCHQFHSLGSCSKANPPAVMPCEHDLTEIRFAPGVFVCDKCAGEFKLQVVPASVSPLTDEELEDAAIACNEMFFGTYSADHWSALAAKLRGMKGQV